MEAGSKICRRRLAEETVGEWLVGVSEAAFSSALERLVEEKSRAGEYRFKKPEERDSAISDARRFFSEFSRKIVELSDGRCVYFTPDPCAKARNIVYQIFRNYTMGDVTWCCDVVT